MNDESKKAARDVPPAGRSGGGTAPETAGGGRPALVAPAVQVYPRKVTGTFRRLKWTVLSILLGLYYVGPWIRWDRGPGVPDQALLVDMPGRRAYFFALEIWPQEVYYLTGLLILGAVGLFLVTALAGRVWCGFTCPQTVWTDLFLWVERLIEGDRNARMRLDKAPLSLGKAARKVAKHAAWLVIAVATGGAWIMYFNDAPTLVRDVFTGQATPTVYGFILLFTTTTYVLAGWAREAVCIYMCPWPRFQGAMFDEDSLIVTYEEWRGEPRGKVKKGRSFEGRGHCVDCTMCVQVCPTGVDIRKGQQMACIGCALCVDACNGIMDKVGLPRGLITYDSIANQLARSRGQPTRTRLVRPRTMIYGALLVLVVAIMAYSLSNRSTLSINVLHDRSPLFVQLSDGDIRDGYTLKVLNKEHQTRTFTLTMRGIAGASLHVLGHSKEGVSSATLPVKPDSVAAFRVFVRAPRASLKGKSMSLTFVLTDAATGRAHSHETNFHGPGR